MNCFFIYVLFFTFHKLLIYKQGIMTKMTLFTSNIPLLTLSNQKYPKRSLSKLSDPIQQNLHPIDISNNLLFLNQQHLDMHTLKRLVIEIFSHASYLFCRAWRNNITCENEAQENRYGGRPDIIDMKPGVIDP